MSGRVALRMCILCCLTAALAGNGGCAESAIVAAGASAGFGLAQGQAESFINGELKAARLVRLDAAVQAVRDAANDAHLPLKIDEPEAYGHYIKAKAEGGPEIKVHLKAKSPMITKIEIRVGFMGDAAVSRLVMARIDDHLGIVPPPHVPIEESPVVAPNKEASNAEKQAKPGMNTEHASEPRMNTDQHR